MGKERPGPKVKRTVLIEYETDIYSGNYRDSTPNFLRYNGGWVSVKTQIVKIEGEQRVNVVPGMAGDTVTGIKIKKQGQ